ncbi:hypothetical protein KFL_006650060 [Klebsormidium nitens]|uniref:TNase-like domain-containing protein n=1 Tax=Klebsormidium nitens TaxID=105231 RepID=A0A1Y1IKG9_KLENI|nr:hypothetical protein KFL_006650060 [Klebsormidium nitens]|eukprot:GAQ90632.1 hypothetical protein KFL_006650060 [Klebsormidium nitens]
MNARRLTLSNLNENARLAIWAGLNARQSAVASEVSRIFRSNGRNRLTDLGRESYREIERLRAECKPAAQAKEPDRSQDDRKRSTAAALWNRLRPFLQAGGLGDIDQSTAIALFDPGARAVVGYVVTTLAPMREVLTDLYLDRRQWGQPDRFHDRNLQLPMRAVWKQLLRVARPGLRSLLDDLSSLDDGYLERIEGLRQAIADFLTNDLLRIRGYRNFVEATLPVLGQFSMRQHLPDTIVRADDSREMEHLALLIRQHNDQVDGYARFLLNRSENLHRLRLELQTRPYRHIWALLQDPVEAQAFIDSLPTYHRQLQDLVHDREKSTDNHYRRIRSVCARLLRLYGIDPASVGNITPQEWKVRRGNADRFLADASDENNDVHKIIVRLLGIDAPEMNAKDPVVKAWAIKARNRMLALVAPGVFEIDGKYARKDINKLFRENVALIWMDAKGWDKYGRCLGDIYLSPDDTKSLQTICIEEGYAEVYGGGTKKHWVPEDCVQKKSSGELVPTT